MVAATSFLILAGSYTSSITTLSFTPNGNASTISLVGLSNVGSHGSPSWLARHPTNSSVIFSTKELEPGYITSYTVNAQGLVTVVDEQASNGQDPAHLLPLYSGEVVEPNYTTGTFQSHILASDGAHFTSTPGNLITFQGSGPNNQGRQTGPHPHEAYQYNSELFIPDLGSDKVWRLGRVNNSVIGQWKINGYIQQPAGSGPRHIATIGNQLYTVHELSNTLTQQTIPDTPGSDFPALIANLTTVPAGVPAGSSYGSAELLLQPLDRCTPSTQRYLYASNRNVSPNTALYDPQGDSIAIFATKPSLSLVAQVHTGLDQIRGLTQSKDGKYIAAAGLVGGGIAIYEVTNGGASLELRARYTGNGSTQVSSFLWL